MEVSFNESIEKLKLSQVVGNKCLYSGAQCCQVVSVSDSIHTRSDGLSVRILPAVGS